MPDEITVSELSERDFLVSEIKKGKAVVLTYLAGILTGFMSGYLEILGMTIISILSGFAVLFILIYVITNRFHGLAKSTIAWIILLYIFSWVTFWIVSMNHPFS
ncbi:MAG: hypothetical protein ACP5RZ_04050 [Thermoplasmata archaeon]